MLSRGTLFRFGEGKMHVLFSAFLSRSFYICLRPVLTSGCGVVLGIACCLQSTDSTFALVARIWVGSVFIDVGDVRYKYLILRKRNSHSLYLVSSLPSSN